MPDKALESSAVSRRDFLATTAATIGAATLPNTLQAQGAAKFRRLNVTNPEAKGVLKSYKKAIAKMLALDPTDPRSWYRNVLVHTLDCPHGNWWFLPWHRAYLGWFEQTCRDLSEDPTFALPYWDWSENLDPTKPFVARIPDVMFEDGLTPTNPAFIPKYKDFEDGYKAVIANSDYWKRIFDADGKFDEQTQYGQLLARGLRFNEDLWFDIINDPRSKLFFDLAEARGLTAAKPELDSATTAAVSAESVIAALRPTDFVGFASAKAPSHSAARGSGPLETGPHNLVHNNIGGFMGDFMSPTDPIFFLHHANIDRLWDVWTRKQQLRGLPILPDGYLVQPPVAGTDYFKWSNEPFLFFTDFKKQPVTKTKAGDYATIGEFNYDYQPGTGEKVVAVPTAAVARFAPRPVQRFTGRIQTAAVRPTASAKVTLTPALLQAAAGPNAPTLFAKITVDMPSLDHGSRLSVFVDGPPDLTGAGPSSANYAGTLAMFGHHLIPAPFTFTVPLSAPIAGLRARRALAADSSLNIRVVAEAGAAPHAAMATHGASPKAEVLAVVVEAY